MYDLLEDVLIQSHDLFITDEYFFSYVIMGIKFSEVSLTQKEREGRR